MTRAEDKCCGPQAIADARGVAHALGIPHYVVDEAVPFERLVIDYFAEEYKAGRTPNPCIMCNERVKFGNLREKAAALGASLVATGHYAIVEHPENSAPVLRKGLDPLKDQSYFLFSLNSSQLASTLFPLGDRPNPRSATSPAGSASKWPTRRTVRRSASSPARTTRPSSRGASRSAARRSSRAASTI